jgi:hypothetical protein
LPIPDISVYDRNDLSKHAYLEASQLSDGWKNKLLQLGVGKRARRGSTKLRSLVCGGVRGLLTRDLLVHTSTSYPVHVRYVFFLLVADFYPS